MSSPSPSYIPGMEINNPHSKGTSVKPRPLKISFALLVLVLFTMLPATGANAASAEYWYGDIRATYTKHSYARAALKGGEAKTIGIDGINNIQTRASIYSSVIYSSRGLGIQTLTHPSTHALSICFWQKRDALAEANVALLSCRFKW